VLTQLEPLLAEFEERGESAIVEGVHLSLNLVVPLLERHPAVVPFLVTISNETKHRERFAVRAKYMSLSPETNRYVKYFRPIRTIQEYLLGRAARHSIPSLNNTNVDRSVDAIHACAFSFLRLEARGPGGPGRASRLLAEYNRHLAARGAWSSKSMLTVLRSRRSEDQTGGAGAAASVAAAEPSAVRPQSSDDERTLGTELWRTDTEPGSVAEEDDDELGGRWARSRGPLSMSPLAEQGAIETDK
jgi:hypothetical protein